MGQDSVTRILFVCLGNICRSPTAEAVMKRLVAEAGLSDSIVVDSAGTGDWHVGGPPDPRSTAAAARRGIVLEGAARQVSAPEHLEDWDFVVAMDASNVRDLRRFAPDADVRLLRDFGDGGGDVPDPYTGGEQGFDHVLDLVEEACAGLLTEVRAAP